ncbi:hypothetical protein L2E82_19574 [Cichorium intybus]|uniref:Uncharacterized protein n=1 Tax=Cichorium intybus TaxID=13427 RepID=A0ACB9FBK0_CICIN|nr:hypothetical protein L2E82_19574 [Cichorium intybus]
MDLDWQTCARQVQTITSNVLTKQGKPLHVLFLKRGVFPSSITLANRLLQMYVKCDNLDDARKLFDEMPQRNCFTWNSMIEGYVKLRNNNESLHLFYAMPHKNTFSWNTIISGLIKATKLNLARKLFNEMPVKNAVAWNSMIHGYAQNGQPAKAISLFKDLKSSCDGVWHIDIYVLATVFGACTDLLGLKLGKIIHGSTIVSGVKFDQVLGSSIVNMYGKCGDLDTASLVLHTLPYPDDFSLSSLITAYSISGKLADAKRIFCMKKDPCVPLWNSLISGYIFNNMTMEALVLFREMRRNGTKEDASTIASVLSACGVVVYGAQMHAHGCKLGVIHDIIVASTLLDTYAKCGKPESACRLFNELNTYDTVLLNSMISVYCSCGRIQDAKRVFQSIRSKTLISWNSMISGLTQNGYPSEALEYFGELNKTGFRIDRFSLASAISTCGAISCLELGQQLFGRATVIGLESDKIVATSLVDFYCKCGHVGNARKLFDQMKEADEASWNSMLMGYATNGYGIEALDLFGDMRKAKGVMPTDITFTAVLSACDHCGLYEEGLKWFYAMKDKYCIDPGIEHYSCMIDLFARAGCFEEAMNLVVSMPFEADVSMWSVILRGCLAHGDTILGMKVAENMTGIDPKNPDVYVQLASIFATCGDWGASAQVRNLMIAERIRKVPGTSWVDH